MENQKPNDGSARDLGREGAGSSMGKDMNQDGGSTGSTGSGGAAISGSTTTSGIPGASSSASTAGSVIDKAKDMSRDVPSTASDMYKTIDKTIDKAAEAAQPMVNRLASTAHAGVDKFSSALSGVGGSMDQRSRQLADAARTFADTGREYVRTSPGTAVVAALGVGYLLAKLLGNRR
ncbi:DUF883 family protein [Massilia psychrophila]|uniref:DUF883 domain-containing protein n=1 Tax=Massilia psychrophila TaxID=1603353 RepID=A0A2G8T2Y6_9BURK|nr:hypothetical protein [Massilia psychrophila]PIL40415.1 hypothetical protein CR103_06995 [Massilia psychrophila]GGE76995.1 hypothetical protein GCM10008020_22190 [Massilia psychrophila]